MPNQPEARLKREKRYVSIIALVVALLVALPAIGAYLLAPARSTYTGFEYNADDHMVYSAWMHQVEHGHVLMDNRFAVDPQPGLTFNAYFFALGNVARIVGIPAACLLARVGFAVLLVFLLYRLVRKLDLDEYGTKLALALAVFGGGIGFLVWHNFGTSFTKPSLLSGLFGGQLPTDIWQPEGFVFPSLLTNSLFAASLCLIVYLANCVLEACESSKPVLGGSIAFLLLMSMHSYDVLLVAMVLVAFLPMCIARGQANWSWVGRVAVMSSGAIPAALWFLYVLKNDPVFAARAATETFSPSFRQLLGGYVLMIAVGSIGLLSAGSSPKAKAAYGAALLAMFALAVAGIASSGYFLSLAAWAALYVFLVGALWFAASESPARNFLLAWWLVGLAAPYFPALFQRKLAMGLSIPWALLAAIGFAVFAVRQERQARNLLSVLGIVLFSGTSVCWLLVRERMMITQNVSNTTRHPVYLSDNEMAIIRYLDARSQERNVVIAHPGSTLKGQLEGSKLYEVPDAFSIYLPDLNPFLSGMSGAYTYAGHWSETPNYSGPAKPSRVSEASAVFDPRLSLDDRRALLRRIGADYVVAPVEEAFPSVPLADLRPFGEIVVDGTQFRLIRLR